MYLCFERWRLSAKRPMQHSYTERQFVVNCWVCKFAFFLFPFLYNLFLFIISSFLCCLLFSSWFVVSFDCVKRAHKCMCVEGVARIVHLFCVCHFIYHFRFQIGKYFKLYKAFQWKRIKYDWVKFVCWTLLVSDWTGIRDK